MFVRHKRATPWKNEGLSSCEILPFYIPRAEEALKLRDIMQQAELAAAVTPWGCRVGVATLLYSGPLPQLVKMDELGSETKGKLCC